MEIEPSYIGLIVDKVITCDETNLLNDLNESHDKIIVLIEEKSSRIILINKYDEIMKLNIENNYKNCKLINFPEGSTLMPGFIDCHVHLTIATDDYQIDHLRLSSADKVLRALKCAQGLLHAGFTTIRSAGDADTNYPTIALAKSINKGDFIGPRIVGAGHYISVTGGGGDINFFSYDNCSCCATDGLIANGKDEMIKAVRQEIKYGSDWIKILVTGAFMSASTNKQDSPENTHFSKDELIAVIEGK